VLEGTAGGLGVSLDDRHAEPGEFPHRRILALERRRQRCRAGGAGGGGRCQGRGGGARTGRQHDHRAGHAEGDVHGADVRERPRDNCRENENGVE